MGNQHAAKKNKEESTYNHDDMRSASMLFINEQEQLSYREREDRERRQIEFTPPVVKLTLGPQLQEILGVSKMAEADIQDLQLKASAPITLNVYTVGHSAVVKNINAVAQNIIKMGGIFHAAIEAFDHEWSFGRTLDDKPGVFCNEPCCCAAHTYRQSVYLGDCERTPMEVERILRRLLPDWKGSSYDLLHKNCCSFSDAFAMELGVGRIPTWVHRFADAGAVLDDDAKAALHALHVVQDHVVKPLREGALHILTQHRKNTGDKDHRVCGFCQLFGASPPPDNRV